MGKDFYNFPNIFNCRGGPHIEILLHAIIIIHWCLVTSVRLRVQLIFCHADVCLEEEGLQAKKSTTIM